MLTKEELKLLLTKTTDFTSNCNNIPIHLTNNSTKLIRNAKSLWLTFAGLTVSDNLPFDFFNKRKPILKNVFVRDFDTSTSYHYYSQKNEDY